MWQQIKAFLVLVFLCCMVTLLFVVLTGCDPEWDYIDKARNECMKRGGIASWHVDPLMPRGVSFWCDARQYYGKEDQDGKR
jgi:hypothetical protein